MRTLDNLLAEDAEEDEVSIPSKREGTCEQHETRLTQVEESLVSIPSKREGTCEPL